jgi:hypothetical protein
VTTRVQLYSDTGVQQPVWQKNPSAQSSLPDPSIVQETPDPHVAISQLGGSPPPKHTSHASGSHGSSQLAFLVHSEHSSTPASVQVSSPR